MIGLFVYQTHILDGGQHRSLSSSPLELHNNPISRYDEPSDDDGELVSVMNAYCTASENNTRHVNGSKVKTTEKKTDDVKVRKASKLTSVGDSHYRNSRRILTVADEDMMDVKMKMANKTAKKRKCAKADKLASALADITDQVNVPVTKPRKNRTASSLSKCSEPYDEDSKPVSVMGDYCRRSEKLNNARALNGSKLKTAAKKNDDVKVRKAYCQSSHKAVAVAAEDVNDVKKKAANKTAKKRKCDKADKLVSVLADITDQVNVPVTKPKTNRTTSNRTKKCTYSLRPGKGDGKVSEENEKKIKQEGATLSSSCNMTVIQRRKMLDSGVFGTSACIPVGNVGVNEKAKKAIKENGIASYSNFPVTRWSHQRSSRSSAGGAVCKHDIATLCSKFSMSLRSSRLSMVCKKVNCSQEKEDGAGNVNETNKQYEDMLPRSSFDITSQTCRTKRKTHFASDDARGEEAADKENSKEVQNGGLQTAENAVEEHKDIRHCLNLDMTSKPRGRMNLSQHPYGIRMTCTDKATSFHMTLRSRPQRQYDNKTLRKRPASVLVSKKHCCIKCDDEPKSQTPRCSNGQKTHRCSKSLCYCSYMITVTVELAV